MTSRISLRYIAVVSLAAAAILALLLTHSGTARSAAATKTALGEVGAFRRAAQPSDAIPNDSKTIFGLVRRIGNPNATDVWASVNDENVCVQLAGGASACAITTKFSGNEPLILGASKGGPGAVAGHPDAEEIAGLVPDGIVSVTVTSTDGSSTTTPVVDNGFYVNIKDRLAKVAWTTADGTVHQEADAPASSGAEEER